MRRERGSNPCACGAVNRPHLALVRQGPGGQPVKAWWEHHAGANLGVPIRAGLSVTDMARVGAGNDK